MSSHPYLNIHQVNVLVALLEVFSKGVRLPDYNRQEGAPEMMLSGEEGD